MNGLKKFGETPEGRTLFRHVQAEPLKPWPFRSSSLKMQNWIWVSAGLLILVLEWVSC